MGKGKGCSSHASFALDLDLRESHPQSHVRSVTEPWILSPPQAELLLRSFSNIPVTLSVPSGSLHIQALLPVQAPACFPIFPFSRPVWTSPARHSPGVSIET